MTKPTTSFDPDRETRPFFWFMTLVLAVMYVVVLIDQPEIRHPLPLALFSVLLVVHIILHWTLRVIAGRPGWTLPYLLVQGALACAITFLANNIGMMFGLFMALVGESIGVYGITRRGVIAAAFYLAISLVNYVWIVGTGQVLWWLLGIGPTVIFVVIYVELYSRQMNANIRAQELLLELQAANQQLTDYANQVEDLTIANERQRMARELHDTLSQGLAGLILQLEAVDAHLSGGRPEKAHAITQQAMDAARSILAASRRAIDDLRHAAPDDLEAALRQEAVRFHEATGIPCEMNISLPSALPPDSCEPLLRIVAEALTNIARHAQASQASLSLSADAEALRLEIRDDGRGFDPATVPPGHYGLVGMRERARLAGGTLTIESATGNGTCITITLPIKL